MRTIAPFIPAHDIARGLLHGAQALLTFAFMLAVMSVACYPLLPAAGGTFHLTCDLFRTFNAGIILTIVIGLGVGETLFGRYAASRSNLH